MLPEELMSAKDKAEDRLYLSMAMVDDKLGTTEVVRTEEAPPYRHRNPNGRCWVLQADYGHGHGWEDVCAENSRSEINQRHKEYIENEGGNYRIVTRREQGEDIEFKFGDYYFDWNDGNAILFKKVKYVSLRHRKPRYEKELSQEIHEATKEAEKAIQKFKQYKLHMEKDMTHDQIIELLMNMTDDKLMSMNKEIVAPFLGSKLQSHVETEEAKEELSHHHRNLNLPPLGQNNE